MHALVVNEPTVMIRLAKEFSVTQLEFTKALLPASTAYLYKKQAIEQAFTFLEQCKGVELEDLQELAYTCVAEVIWDRENDLSVSFYYLSKLFSILLLSYLIVTYHRQRINKECITILQE